jgi:hypothetical protein
LGKKNKKEIEITNDKNIIDTSRTELCKIINIRKNEIDIDFKGYGITIKAEDINIDEYSLGSNIEIQYEGEIGKPDFKILN